ncbi:serine/threonine-protein kinase [Actinomadura viridis]|uniref:serine/threonine-protein kinase n=1 Tax=Actinomadura viridis TaxID=58110 RepID=UPI001E3BE4C2|nr:serine/threonine-protein kinase [Actinomadura viridis]
MGTVWQAHDEVLGRDVAVKEVILPHGLTDEERSVHHKRTFREARTAARLGHPGVVTVYDVVEEDDRPWIIMELIQARSLDQVIKEEGPLEPRRAAEIGRQMLAALHAAHEAGVLHRDVKPSNVLVTRGDRAVLTDFGIATAAGDATLTQTGLVMGSPAYIAPERARGRTAGPASDLWSLGVTLYAMTHGKSPFERSEPMAALVAVISEDPDPPDRAGRLAPVIRGLLRKDPDRRMDAIEAGALLDGIVRQESFDTQRTLAVEVPMEELLDDPAAGEAPPPSGTRPVAEADEARSASPSPDVPPASRDGRGEALDDGRGAPSPAGEEPGGAMSWRPGPPTEPAGSPTTAGPGRPGPAARGDNRNALVIGAIILVALLVTVGIVLAKNGGDENAGTRGSRGPSGTPKTGTSSPPPSPAGSSPRASVSPSSGVPAGFRVHKDRTGFSIAIPKDWKGPQKRSSSPSSVFFEPPGGEGYIQVDQTSDPNASALEDWENYEPTARGRFSGYEKIKIAPVREGEPVSDPSGKKAADWEWTYDGRSGRLHALNRGFVMNGTGYAIVLVAPHDGWDRTFAEMAPVYEFFEAAD